MDLSKLSEIREKITKLPSDKITEAETKRVVIEPILSILGWDMSGLEEVKNEYRAFPSDNPVDYGIFLGSKPCFFLEAKALHVGIADRKTVTQAVAYASVCGTEWAVITNGREWAIYNALMPVDAAQKIFESFSLSEERAAYLLELLSKSSIVEGKMRQEWKRRQMGLSIMEKKPLSDSIQLSSVDPVCGRDKKSEVQPDLEASIETSTRVTETLRSESNYLSTMRQRLSSKLEEVAAAGGDLLEHLKKVDTLQKELRDAQTNEMSNLLQKVKETTERGEYLYLLKWNRWLLDIIDQASSEDCLVLALTDESEKIWGAWAEAHPSKRMGECTQSEDRRPRGWSRLCLRVAKVLHYLKHGALAAVSPVDATTLTEALNLAGWLISDAGQDGWSPSRLNTKKTISDKLVTALASLGHKGATLRDLCRKGLGKRDRLKAELDVLEGQGIVSKMIAIPKGRVGRPAADRWLLAK